ncbi:MAG TPA: dihydrodipicolinate synthase family protein [Burkholderiales bacterium]|nr:dihydrodipicolinate synthase family protein [Burkholderiales bacterium]
MPNAMTSFHGIFPYLVSPIDSVGGRVRERVLRDLVEHVLQCGVHGLSPLGSTGEFAYLSLEQREDVVRVVVDAAAGRVPVLAGVAAFSTAEALRQAEAYARLGVDGLILILQQMFPLPARGIEAYFGAVAEAFPHLSMTLYTNPGLLGGDIPMDVLEALSHLPNIEYFKDASSNTGRILTLLNRMGERIRVFSASAHVPLLVLRLGGVGWMAGPACAMPRECVRLYDLVRADRWHEALAEQRRQWAINEVFAKYALAACIKTALQLQGFEVGPPIAPQQPLGPEAVEDIRRALAQLA